MLEQKPKIGEIWLVVMPIIYVENEEVSFKTQKRPVLILDDGRGFIVEEDNKNYHVFKLTSQNDSYKRILIKNWRELGLKTKSYIRIEMPIKIEESQFVFKITELPLKQMIEYYQELYKIVNISMLEKLANRIP